MAVDQVELEPGETEEIEETAEELAESEVTEENTETEAETEKSEETEELQVTIGEEAPASEEAKEAPGWVKEVRRRNRELERELRELKANVVQAPAVKVLKKPKLEEHDYDEQKFEQAMDAYYRDKAEQEKRQAEVEAKAEQERKEAEQKRVSYVQAAQALKVPDYKAAEDEVVETLSTAQQGIILSGADKPELLVYALGKNPTKLQELASIKDPVKFAFAAAKLEKDLKVSNAKSKATPRPEPTVKGTSGVTSSQATLDRLREEAAKTGDLSKVQAFKKQMASRK